jgi:hypothetical protein
MKTGFPEDFMTAAGEYLWMLSRKFPQKASLKLVGDKYMLARDMRQVLYRGISAESSALKRKEKIAGLRPGDNVLVDAYNVLFTVNNYLLGKPVFISNDGLLRDAGEMRGSIVNKPVFARSVNLLLEALKALPPATFRLYLDEPVSYSRKLGTDLSGDMARMEIRGEALTARSADHMLKEESSDAICTSDSAIIDHYTGRIFDLPRFILDQNFRPEFPSLLNIVVQNGSR